MALELGAGKEVLSYCNKCKLALSHIIVAMKDAKNIQKVKCKTCGSSHAYKDPSGVAKKKTTRSKKTTEVVSVSDVWMKKMSTTKIKSRKYTIREFFSIGDIVDHPKFGPGIVEAVIDNDKIDVMFRHDIKTLIHNKK